MQFYHESYNVRHLISHRNKMDGWKIFKSNSGKYSTKYSLTFLREKDILRGEWVNEIHICTENDICNVIIVDLEQ